MSSVMMGVCQIIIPYVAGGWYAREVFRREGRPLMSALIISVVPAVCERLLLVGIGAWLTVLGVYGAGQTSLTMERVFDLIQTEALPYFTPEYIIWGLVVSVPVCMVTAAMVRRTQEVTSS